MGSRLVVLTLAFLLVTAVVSLLPLHDDYRVPITPRCHAAKARLCELNYAHCVGLPAAERGACRAEYSVLCRRACGEPIAAGTYRERLRDLGPWYLSALPGGVEGWARLRELLTGSRTDRSPRGS